MSELSAVAVGGLFTLLGSAVTGWFTYRAAVRQRELERYKNELGRALRNVAAFHRLEERYTQALASSERTAESWKREIRRQQAEAELPTPSESGTWRISEQRITDLQA